MLKAPRHAGQKEYILYTYSLTGIDTSTKVRFVYALKGRKEEQGLVAHYKGRFIAPACFIVPADHEGSFKEIFLQWGVQSTSLRIQIVGGDAW